MAITSSTAAFDGPPQADGRRQVIETHVLSTGAIITMTYYEDPDEDIDAAAAARAPSLLAGLADAEAKDNVERDGPPSLSNQTDAEFATRVREMVRAADTQRACYLAWWLVRRIEAGDVTDATWRAAFGLNAGQWAALKSAKLYPRHDAWAAVLAATGE